MSQTDPVPQTNNLCTSRYISIKIAYHISIPWQLPQISSASQKEHQRMSHRYFPRMIFKAKALALLIAVSLLPVMASRTAAQELAAQSIPELRTQAEQARIGDPEDIVSDSPNQLPITLIVETVVASLLLVGLLTAFFANRSIRPVKANNQEEAGSGRPDLSSQLVTLGSAALDPIMVTEQQTIVAEQTRQLTEVILRLRQVQYLEELLKSAVKEARRALMVDRVFIYRFNSDWSGFVVAESVAPGWPSCLRIKVTDTYFTESNLGVEKYKNGRVCVTNDIHAENLAECHIKLLEQFAIKSQIVAPILKNNELFALAIANQCSEVRTWQQHEVDFFAQLAKQLGFLADQISFQEEQEAEAERVSLLTEITLRIRQAHYLEDLLKITVKEVRRAIKTDRVLIYGLDSSNWDGIVVAESVAPGWPKTLRVRIDDPCLREKYVEMYQNGHVTVINNIYQEPRQECYRNRLEQFAVKASIVAPILKNNQLLGLLIAHHCLEARDWQQSEIDLFVHLAAQAGLAINQVSLIEQMEEQMETEEI